MRRRFALSIMCLILLTSCLMLLSGCDDNKTPEMNLMLNLEAETEEIIVSEDIIEIDVTES